MPVEYKEQWGVQIGKETYILDEKQIKILKEADVGGVRGIVWFDKFAISIPHIQGVFLISRQIKNQLSAGEKDYIPTPEERARTFKVIKRIREKFNFV